MTKAIKSIVYALTVVCVSMASSTAEASKEDDYGPVKECKSATICEWPWDLFNTKR